MPERIERMEFHPVANIFPLMEGREFEALVEDIRTNGLMEPITTYQGKIIDGRNRYRACIEAEVKPRFIEFDGCVPLINFILSLNLHRRHLDEGQRGIVAAKVESLRHGQRADISRDANLHVCTRSEAADLLNVSPRTVASASKVLREGIPELVREVESGNIAVSTASKIASLPPEKQAEEIAKPHFRTVNTGENEWYTPKQYIELARTNALPLMENLQCS
jgi:hypothetical protein